jgi:hypothetical protein
VLEFSNRRMSIVRLAEALRGSRPAKRRNPASLSQMDRGALDLTLRHGRGPIQGASAGNEDIAVGGFQMLAPTRLHRRALCRIFLGDCVAARLRRAAKCTWREERS